MSNLGPRPIEIISAFFDNVDHLRGDNSTVDLTYTYANSKWMCHRDFYFFHVWAVYGLNFAALACFVTIMVPPLKWMHVWFGRIYIVLMIWATFASLLIYNTGLPDAVLYSFLYTMIGVTMGWIIIKFHQAKLHHAAVVLVDSRLGEEQRVDASFKLQEAIAQARKEVGWAKTATQRFLSYKALHGFMMFWSWFGLAGRIFASNQSGDFTCYTYPTFKAVDTDQYRTANMTLEGLPLSFLPIEDPDFDKQIWTRMGGDYHFAGAVGGFPVVTGIVVGIVFSKWAANRENRMLESAKVIELS